MMRRTQEVIEGLEAMESAPIAPSYCSIARLAAEEIKWLKSLLDDRDKFIVERGLWDEFVEALRTLQI